MTRILAYGSIPKDSGTFTFYRSLHARLPSAAWDVRCVTIGASEAALWKEDFADDGCVKLASTERELKQQAMRFVDWCVEQRVSAVMPVNSRAMLGAIPHLPKTIHVVARCADMSASGYRRTTYAREFVSHVVATTPRHLADLPSYGVGAEKTTLIPHGIEVERFRAQREPHQGPLHIVFLGRLEHEQKGILYVPGILERLAQSGIPFRMTFAGSGVYREQVEKRLQHHGASVEFLGTVPRDGVPALLGQADILLFPSHHEGFGFSLIEAMAAGCVPVASRLPGVTDFIVEDGQCGLLCAVGDEQGFAQAVAALHHDRKRLHAMSAAAADTARRRFSEARMAQAYAALLDAVVSQPRQAPDPLPWSMFKEPALDPRRWHDVIPRPWKSLVRRTVYSLKR